MFWSMGKTVKDFQDKVVGIIMRISKLVHIPIKMKSIQTKNKDIKPKRKQKKANKNDIRQQR